MLRADIAVGKITLPVSGCQNLFPDPVIALKQQNLLHRPKCSA